MSGYKAAAVTMRSVNNFLPCFYMRQEWSHSISQLYSPKIFNADMFPLWHKKRSTRPMIQAVNNAIIYIGGHSTRQ